MSKQESDQIFYDYEGTYPTHENTDDCACEVCTIIRDSGILPASGPVIDANESGKENHEAEKS